MIKIVEVIKKVCESFISAGVGFSWGEDGDGDASYYPLYEDRDDVIVWDDGVREEWYARLDATAQPSSPTQLFDLVEKALGAPNATHFNGARNWSCEGVLVVASGASVEFIQRYAKVARD